MVKDIDLWMKSLVNKLLGGFGGRVVFIGLQGSYKRGEATEKSDIDIVFILDSVSIDDLKKYKEIIRSMPYCEKACGFTCGLKEFVSWSKQDLFQLLYDTAAYYGNMGTLIGTIEKEDIANIIKLSAGNLYHEICHRYLFNDNLAEQAENLKTAYKTVFFIFQACVFLETGRYFSSRDELSNYLNNTERKILNTYKEWDKLEYDRGENPDFYFSQLLSWCGEKLISL